MKGRKTGGRSKGTPNKVTSDLRKAILGALDAAGGQAYLEKVAKADPRTFCTLLGRVLPMQVEAEVAATVEVSRIELVAPDLVDTGTAHGITAMNGSAKPH